MKKTIILWLIIAVTLCIPLSCSNGMGGNNVDRTATSEGAPYIVDLNWPDIFTELPEGRLVITGTLVCPNGPDPRAAIQLFVFPFDGYCGGVPSLEKSEGTEKYNDPLNSPYILGLEQTVRDYLDESRKGLRRKAQNALEDWWIPNCQREIALVEDNNEYTYFYPDTGRFRLDFDQWCRFKFGNKALVLVGLDALGEICMYNNIYCIPNYSAGATDAIGESMTAYGAMMSDFGRGMIDALSFYPNEYAVDIAAIAATINLYEQAYMVGPTQTHWGTIGEAYYQQMGLIAQNIGQSLYKDWFLYAADWISFHFKFSTKHFNRGHFQRLWGIEDPVQNYWDSVAWQTEYYNEFPITVQRETLPNGAMIVTFDILNVSEPLAHFTMTGSPTEPLEVAGIIGTHEIVWDDYNPYFLQIFFHLVDQGFFPVMGEF